MSRRERILAMSERNILAMSVLTIALDGGMPDSLWQTDRRITWACLVLDIDQDEAQIQTEDNHEEWMFLIRYGRPSS